MRGYLIRDNPRCDDEGYEVRTWGMNVGGMMGYSVFIREGGS